MLPYNRWRRVSTRTGQGDTLHVPLGGRVVAVDVSSKLATVLDTSDDVQAFLWDTDTATRYVQDASGVHVVANIGSDTLTWESAVYAGPDPVTSGYSLRRRGRTVTVTLGADTIELDYPDELLFQGLPVDNGGPLIALDGTADDDDAYIVLHRAFEESDEDADQSIAIYRIGPDGLLDSGLVTPDTAVLTGDPNSELMGDLAFRVGAAQSSIPLKVKRVSIEVAQSVQISTPDGTLTELAPSTKTQGVLIANPPPAFYDLDVTAFDFDGSTYTLASLSRIGHNLLLGQFTFRDS